MIFKYVIITANITNHTWHFNSKDKIDNKFEVFAMNLNE